MLDVQLETASVANLSICLFAPTSKNKRMRKSAFEEIPSSFASSHCTGDLCPVSLASQAAN